MRLGAENSSHANQLDQDIVELTDDVTLVRGKHTITIRHAQRVLQFPQRVHSEPLRTVPVQQHRQLPGRTRAALCRQLLQHERPAAKRPSSPCGSSASTSATSGGRSPNLTLTYGVRFDTPNFPDKPARTRSRSPSSVTRTDVVPAPKMWSPRIGFNWDLSRGSAARSQLRGGIGYFTGRTPYVWLSNQYGNNGITSRRFPQPSTRPTRFRSSRIRTRSPRVVTGGGGGSPEPQPDRPRLQVSRQSSAATSATTRTSASGAWWAQPEFLYTEERQ